MSISCPGHEGKIVCGPKCNGQHPSAGAAFTCLMLGCGLLLPSLKSIGNVPLTSPTAGSGLWVWNVPQKMPYIDQYVPYNIQWLPSIIILCKLRGKKPAPAFTFLYAFKSVVNTLLDIGHGEFEGIYPFWFAWGGKNCISLLPTAKNYFSSFCRAQAPWNTPTHTEPLLSCTRTLFNQTFQSIDLCNPHFFQDKPQCFRN